MSDLNITNKYGIRLSDIQKGDILYLDEGAILSGIFNRYERYAYHGIVHHKLWGFWKGSKFEQYGLFERIIRHEPQFKPYDPTQVGDREDDT